MGRKGECQPPEHLKNKILSIDALLMIGERFPSIRT